MSDERITDLIGRYHAGELSEEDRAEFERTLLSSPAAREQFWKHAQFHALLARWGQEEWGRRMAAQPPSAAPASSLTARNRRQLWPRRAAWFFAAAACVALMALLLQNFITGKQAISPPSADIAVLAATIDAHWAAGTPPRVAGATLRAGPMHLESGAVRIEFVSGARLIVQGSADIELQSDMQAFCRAGRVTAYVPGPARGFKILAPGIEVVDLGTEFGLAVADDSPPQVHVFAGTVTVGFSGGSATRVDAGQAVVAHDGRLASTPIVPGIFLRDSDFGRLAASASELRKDAWHASAALLSRDPAALLHLLFDADTERSRTAPNRATGIGAAPAGGTIVGCNWADGRWEGTRAVTFRGGADRVRVDVPGSFRAMTLLAWMRFDAMPNAYDVLLMPDATMLGTVRWSLTKDGELRFGVSKRIVAGGADWEVVISPQAVDERHIGEWLLLATTFDGKTVRHFVDGRLVKSLPAFSPEPLLIGTAEIGHGRGPAPRAIQGRLDEFALLSRALSPDEVQALYVAGRPLNTSNDRR